MYKPFWKYFLILFVFSGAMGIGLIWKKHIKTEIPPVITVRPVYATPFFLSSPSPSPQVTTSSTPLSLREPIADFKSRITKKMFGTYVTPSNSPVQPERFTGYHTGVDVEYGDVQTDVPVYAVGDGKVVKAEWVSGYGGLLVEQALIQGKSVFVLYGHMRAASLPQVGALVQAGDRVGVLGTAFSKETDGERRHLHFAVYKNDPVDIRGYVPGKEMLSAWIDPLTLY